MVTHRPYVGRPNTQSESAARNTQISVIVHSILVKCATKANAATLRRAAGGELKWLLEHETWWPGVAFGNASCAALMRDLPPVEVPACHGCAHCLPGACGGCLGL